jgi:DNA mismatch repair protein MSH5
VSGIRSDIGGGTRDDDQDDYLDEVIMAVEMKDNRTVGCAYYNALNEALHLHEDIAMAGMELIETQLMHAQPTTVIVSNRAPEKLIRYLEVGAQDVDKCYGYALPSSCSSPSHVVFP